MRPSPQAAPTPNLLYIFFLHSRILSLLRQSLLISLLLSNKTTYGQLRILTDGPLCLHLDAWQCPTILNDIPPYKRANSHIYCTFGQSRDLRRRPEVLRRTDDRLKLHQHLSMYRRSSSVHLVEAEEL